ncbi:hypothetical protein J3Q07_16455 [Pseudomonas sp. D4-18]|uniref:hypothetical protein n=1 Tax=Pseudomonas sp. D4-18 TaxID=2817395 RepID=UPI003DA9D62D
MKLILKRVARNGGAPGPFALHSEDGQPLPCQTSTSMESRSSDQPVKLIVIFNVDGDQITVEGDA